MIASKACARSWQKWKAISSAAWRAFTVTDNHQVRPVKPPPSLGEQIGAKEHRKLKARRNAAQGVWFGLGMMGLVGWAVVPHLRPNQSANRPASTAVAPLTNSKMQRVEVRHAIHITGSTRGLQHRGQRHQPFAFQLPEQMPTRDLAQTAIVLAPIPDLA